MTLTNPPAAVEALRDMLLNCATITTDLLMTTGDLWYPKAAKDPDAGSATSLPFAVLAETDHNRSRYAAGAGGMPTGSLTCVLYVATEDVGIMEQYARDLADELMILQTGLPITDVNTTLAEEPATSAKHTTPTTSITLEIEWGLTS